MVSCISVLFMEILFSLEFTTFAFLGRVLRASGVVVVLDIINNKIVQWI